MSALKATPGPWTVDNEHAYHVVAYPDGVATTVADTDPAAPRVPEDDEEALANANLIAAAPALYEALADLVESWRAPDGSLPRGPKCVRAYNALKQARGDLVDPLERVKL